MGLRVSRGLFKVLYLVATFIGIQSAAFGASSIPAIFATADRQAEELATIVRGSLDVRSGGGTGQMANLLAQKAQSLNQQWDGLSLTEKRSLQAELFKLIKEYFGRAPGGRTFIEVHFYSQGVAKANRRLLDMGLGDVMAVRQSDEARLLEMFYQYTPKLLVGKPATTPAEILDLSRRIYGDSVVEGTVVVPYWTQSNEETAKLFERVEKRFSALGHSLKLVSKPEVVNHPEAVVLPPADEPLPEQATKDARLKKVRQWVNPLIGGFGTFLGAASGHAPVGGAAGAAAVGVLEFQFSKLSDRLWNKVWLKYGFKALVLVNALYPLIVASVVAGVAQATGESNVINMKEIFVKNFVVGMAVFMASFASMQKALARLWDDGEMSAATRFRFETLWGFVPQAARGFAIGVSMLGFQRVFFNLLGIDFGVGDVLGLGVQAGFALGISAPLWLKILYGDRMVDRTTGKLFRGESNSSNASLFSIAGAKTACSTFVMSLTNRYTQLRR